MPDREVNPIFPPRVFMDAVLACQLLSDHLESKNGAKPVLQFQGGQLIVDERIRVNRIEATLIACIPETSGEASE